MTRYAVTYENPGSVLPAFLPDFAVQLKNIHVELDGGAFESAPFPPVGEERDQGASYDTGASRDSGSVGGFNRFTCRFASRHGRATAGFPRRTPGSSLHPRPRQRSG